MAKIPVLFANFLHDRDDPAISVFFSFFLPKWTVLKNSVFTSPALSSKSGSMKIENVLWLKCVPFRGTRGGYGPSGLQRAKWAFQMTKGQLLTRR